MKKQDVIQPVAMSSAFAEGVYSATSTDDFEIPAATSTTADDSCVMDDGFLPITSTALDDGGKAPERKNFNGMFYLSTDQRFYLQNGGFITYNPDVATAIGGYPQDAILDFIDSNGNYKKVRSLIDDNSNNFVADETLIDGTNWEEISMGGGASRNIGEIVPSTIPLTDAGLHLLDGALIQSDGFYGKFVDYIATLYNESPKESNITEVGSLTDNNGVLSGFSTNIYAALPQVFNPGNSDWEMVFKANMLSSDTEGFLLGENNHTTTTGYYGGLSIKSNKVYFRYSANKTQWDIALVSNTTLQAGSSYEIKIERIGSTYNMYINGILDNSITSSINVNYLSIIGNCYNVQDAGYSYPFLGSIDLNGCYINIDGQRWWSGVNPAWATDETEWQATVTTYGSCGKYVYDSVNNTVRLPKVSDILQGTTDVTALGNLVEAGLPNITGTFGTCEETSAYYSGAFSATLVNAGASGSSTGASFNVTMDASRSNSIYGNSLTVQPQTIKVLYYIVIANSTKTDIQVNIDNIATDLNGKADVDLTNVNDSGTSRGAGWAMPSNTYIDLTLGASGTKYTAPANGWVWNNCSSNANNGLTALTNFTKGYSVSIRGSAGAALAKLLPVAKGDIFEFNYDNASTNYGFRFIYAQGSESEAS